MASGDLYEVHTGQVDKLRNKPHSLGRMPPDSVGPQEKAQDKDARRPAILNQKACCSTKPASAVSLDQDSRNISR
ncbi:Aminopeptidase N [Manis pentadactyla]|nr:Aminopeptidase N [Manis pentadactyla]